LIYRAGRYLEQIKVFFPANSISLHHISVMAVAWKKDHKTVLKWNELSIEIVNGDITNESTDMIVNSTDAQLRHSVGLAAAIRNAAGASIVVSYCTYSD
jgi:hypothetical protein